MNHPSNDTVAHLTEELERVRRELARLREGGPKSPTPGFPRRGRVWTAIPLLMLGALLLSAQAPATQDDLEKRVSALEARLLEGPGTTTRIRTPFEVVDPTGNVILQVTHGEHTAGGVAIWQQSTGGGGITIRRGGQEVAGLGANGQGVSEFYLADANGIPRVEVLSRGAVLLRNQGGESVAGMLATDRGRGRLVIGRGEENIFASLEEDDDGGALKIQDTSGELVLGLGVDDAGAGRVSILQGDREVAALGLSREVAGGELVLSNEEGYELATLGPSAGHGGAGTLAVANTDGTIVANVSGGVQGGGAVIVGNSGGQGVAQLSSGAEGRGLVQVFQPGGHSVVVLTQDEVGGLLQIKNGAGTPVASFKAEAKGGGYWQLTDPAGNNVVDAGFDGMAGLVRAGPHFLCAPAVGTALVGVALLPDCIKGKP